MTKFNEGKRAELNVLNKDNLKISYDIEEIMDKIKDIKNPQSFFLTNDRSVALRPSIDKSQMNNN